MSNASHLCVFLGQKTFGVLPFLQPSVYRVRDVNHVSACDGPTKREMPRGYKSHGRRSGEFVLDWSLDGW